MARARRSYSRSLLLNVPPEFQALLRVKFATFRLVARVRRWSGCRFMLLEATRFLGRSHRVDGPGDDIPLSARTRHTPAEREIKGVLSRGGAPAGNSAGAIAIGCAWLTWLPDPSVNAETSSVRCRVIAVSPHANVARGYVTDSEVLRYLRQHPGMIGIDH